MMSPRLLLLLPPMLWGGLLAQGSRRYPLQETVTVQESLCVFVPCKLSYSQIFSTYLFLFRERVDIKNDLPVATNKPSQKVQERTKGRFFLPVDSMSNNCSLTIRDVNMKDNGMYFFYIETFTGLQYTAKKFSLKVAALTQTPDILIPGTLEAGCPRTLTCSVPWACEWGTPPIFSWTSAAHTSLGPRSHHLSSMLTLTPRPQDHGTTLTCQVHFPATGVTVETTIQLNVTYAPQNMAISIFQGNSTALKILQTTSLPILEGEALRLLCVAESNPPAQLSWFRGSAALNATPISSTAMLELPYGLGAAEEGEFTCQAQHPRGSQNISLSLSVFCKPEPKARGVLGVVGGSTIMALALLSFCLCLIFRVKICRKKAVQLVQSLDNDVNPVVGSGSGVHQHQFQTDSSSAHPGPDGASPAANEEQELHYAFIRFHNLKLQEQEDANIVYSEIKTHK